MGSTSALAGQYIILVGNQGVGKSSILNSTIGKVCFESGLCLGRGLTTAVDTKTIASVTYSDTPGLDDIAIREKAAKEISNLLRKGGTIKLVFVIALEAGRLRPADLHTMRIVLDAIRGVNSAGSTGDITENNFSVIVNKCEPGVLALLEANPKQRIIFEGMIGVGSTFKYIAYLKLVPEATGRSNHLLSDEANYLEFFKSAPEMTIATNDTIAVDASDYDSRVEQLEQENKRLEIALESAIRDRRNGKPVSEFLSRATKRFNKTVDYLIFQSRTIMSLI